MHSNKKSLILTRLGDIKTSRTQKIGINVNSLSKE